MLCLKTFKSRSPKDFDTYSDYVDFVNENIKYSKEHSTVEDYVGKCKDSDLPSFHPYWKEQVKNSMRKNLETLLENIEQIEKDPSKMQYIYNKTTTLNMLYEKVRILRVKINT